MPVVFREEIRQRLRESGVLAVITVHDAEQAVPLGRALLAGGIPCIELTLRTPVALAALERLKRGLPEMLVGAGTVLTPTDLANAREAGADFAVSPGVNPRVLQAAADADFSFAPGVATPTDIEAALEFGCRMLKFFPAEPIGGLPYFRAITAPYDHLGVEYIPLGSLNEQLMPSWLERPSVVTLGGSWMANAELIANKQWDKITALSRQASDIVQRVRQTL